MEQIPAADLLANVVAGGVNLTEAAMAENYIDRTNNLSSFTNHINRVMPNVPMLQQGMNQMWQAVGMPTEK